MKYIGLMVLMAASYNSYLVAMEQEQEITDISSDYYNDIGGAMIDEAVRGAYNENTHLPFFPSCWSCNWMTEKEVAAWVWMTDQRRDVSAPILQSSSFLKNLSLEDYNVVYHQGIVYQKDSESTVQPIERYIEAFYALVQAADNGQNALPHDIETLKSAWLKTIRNIFSIYATNENPMSIYSPDRYVFSKLLTKEEQDFFRENDCRKDPQATENVVRKYSNLLVEELVKSGEVENTDAAKSAKSKNLYDDRMAHAKK